jgi:hypothetical protein
MNVPSYLIRSVAQFTVAIVLTACSTSTTTTLPPAFASAAIPAARSWLLYVSGGNGVTVMSYPSLKTVQVLTGFIKMAYSDCVDAKGNVWIVDNGAPQIVEYAHGGSKPVAKLKLPKDHIPTGCAVDPKSGDLAVSDETSRFEEPSQGLIDIFKNAKGSARLYKVLTSLPSYLGYDDNGNLFFDGFAQRFAYGELPYGAHASKDLKVVYSKQENEIGYPAGVAFDGTYMTVADGYTGTIYRLDRPNPSTGHVEIVGETVLSGQPEILDYTFDGANLIAAALGVQVYAYPAGGNVERSAAPANAPIGVALSK